MTDQGNGQPAPKRYVIVDHHGDSVEIEADSTVWVVVIARFEALPVGGRFTVTRVA